MRLYISIILSFLIISCTRTKKDEPNSILINEFLKEQGAIHKLHIENSKHVVDSYERYVRNSIQVSNLNRYSRSAKVYDKVKQTIKLTSILYNYLGSTISDINDTLYLNNATWSIPIEFKIKDYDPKIIEYKLNTTRDSILKFISNLPKKGEQGAYWDINTSHLDVDYLKPSNIDAALKDSRPTDTSQLKQIIQKYNFANSLDQLNEYSSLEKVKILSQIQTSILLALNDALFVLKSQLPPNNGCGFSVLNNYFIFPLSNLSTVQTYNEFIIGVSDTSYNKYLSGVHLKNYKLKYAIDTPLHHSQNIYETVSDSTGLFAIQAPKGKHKIYGKFLVDSTLDVWLPMESEFEF